MEREARNILRASKRAQEYNHIYVALRRTQRTHQGDYQSFPAWSSLSLGPNRSTACETATRFIQQSPCLSSI